LNYNDAKPHVLEVYEVMESVGVLPLAWVLHSRETKTHDAKDILRLVRDRAKELQCSYSTYLNEVLPRIVDDLELRGQLTLRKETKDERSYKVAMSGVCHRKRL
jgi:hypothetical protein